MNLTINSNAAKKYGLTGATLLAYLQYRDADGHDNEGRFTAPHPPLREAFRLTRNTFDRQRDRIEQEGLIHVTRFPHITLYRLNHEAINQLTGGEHGH